MPASEAATASERREIRNGVSFITVTFPGHTQSRARRRAIVIVGLAGLPEMASGIAEMASNDSGQFAASQQTIP
jgi:hypothetical protein